MAGFISVPEAARLKNVTRQAIYLAIREQKLRAFHDGTSLKIFKADLTTYYKGKYSRDRSTIDGQKLFDRSQGQITVAEAAKMIKVNIQKIYYACRSGQLVATRKRASWIICIEDLLKFQKKYLTQNFTQKRRA